jgi:hypothetical protein
VNVVIDSSIVYKFTVSPIAQGAPGVFKTTARLKLSADFAGKTLLKEITFPVTLTIQ